MVPGFEGIFHTKWLRRIKVVDRYYMNYNDFGHLDQDPKVAALDYQIGPKSVITFPSGGQQLPGQGFYEISGLAWSGGGAIKQVEVSTDGGKSWNKAEIKGTPQRMAHARFGYQWNWDGQETELLSRCTDEIGQVQPSRAQIAKYWNKPFDETFSVPGLDNSIQPWRIASDGSVHQWLRLGFSRSRCSWASPRWRSRRPTASDARRPQRKSARGISPSVRPERNSRRDAEPPRRARSSIARRGARDATGRRASTARRPILKSKAGPNAERLGTGTNPAASRAVRDDGLGLHQSRHASQSRGNADRR